MYAYEVDNLVFEEDFLQVERDLARFKAARLAREAEQAKREEEVDQSFQSMQANSGDVDQEACALSDLDKASTADLLSLQSKLQAAEGKVKVFLRQKQTQTVLSQKLKEREETKIRKHKREISSIKTRGAQRRTT